jgi:hypothetical protein
MRRVDREQKPPKPKRGARRRSRGRPPGTQKHFKDDPDRFALAAMACAIDGFGLGPYDAALRVLMVFLDEPIELRSLGGIAVQASVDLRIRTTKGRSETLVAKYKALQANATPDDVDWISGSACGLGLLAKTIQHPNPAIMHLALNMLFAHDWEPILKRIAKRIEAAFQTNMPPIEEPLSRAAKAMLAELRKNH